MKIKIGNKTFEVSKNAEGSYPEETTLEFTGILRDEAEEASFIENHKSDARVEGVEMATKRLVDKLGYREGFAEDGLVVRNLDHLLKYHAKHTLADAKIEPEEKLKKITKTLEEKETALQSALSKVGEKEKEFTTYKNQSKIDKTLDSLIPEKTILPREDMKMILKSKLKFDTDEIGNIVVLDEVGNVMKDPTTANAKSPKDVVDNFFKDNQTYLKPIEGGAGGGDSYGGGSKKSIDKFIEEQRIAGNSPNSAEFNEALKVQNEAGLIDVE